MKIWIVNHYAIPPAFGGLNRHYYFSREFRKKGIETRIFSSGKIHNTDINMTKNSELYKIVDCDGVEYTFVKTSDYKGNGIKRMFSFLQFPYNVLRTMKKFFKTEKPDVIYASSPELFATWVACSFAKKNKIPIVVEIRDLWPESIVELTRFTRKNPIIKILYAMERKIYEKADRIIFTFEGGKDYITEKGWDTKHGGKINIEKVCYVNNGVDLEQYKKDKEENSIEDEVLDRKDLFKVVYTGSVRRTNCIWMLVEAARKLQDSGNEKCAIVIYGDGTEKESLIKKSEEYGLKNIFFRGRVDRKFIPGILSRSDLNVFVGENDSMNRYGLSLNKMFDYMASGKPILTSVKSNYDNVTKYNCGIVLESNDINSIYNGILSVMNMDSEKYSLYCTNALKAAENFDYKVHAGELEKIFNGVMEERKNEAERFTG